MDTIPRSAGLNAPECCPQCGAGYYLSVLWTGGSPPYGPDSWQCQVCGAEWSTGPARPRP